MIEDESDRTKVRPLWDRERMAMDKIRICIRARARVTMVQQSPFVMSKAVLKLFAVLMVSTELIREKSRLCADLFASTTTMTQFLIEWNVPK